MKLLALVLITASAFGQIAPATDSGISVFYRLPGATSSALEWLTLDPPFRITKDSAGKAHLTADAPRAIVENVKLSILTAKVLTSGKQYTYTLSRTPAKSTAIFLFVQGYSVAVATPSLTLPKQLTITATADMDNITIAYSTFEP